MKAPQTSSFGTPAFKEKKTLRPKKEGAIFMLTNMKHELLDTSR